MIFIVHFSRWQVLHYRVLVSNTTSIESFQYWTLRMSWQWMIRETRAFSRNFQSYSLFWRHYSLFTSWFRGINIRLFGVTDISSPKMKTMSSTNTKASSSNRHSLKKMILRASILRGVCGIPDSLRNAWCYLFVLGHSSIFTWTSVVLAPQRLPTCGASLLLQSCGSDYSSL